MSDTLTPEQRLRAFFRSRDDHDRLCMTRAPKSTPDHLRECDCYAKPDVVAHELIDEIEAENATLRAERDVAPDSGRGPRLNRAGPSGEPDAADTNGNCRC